MRGWRHGIGRVWLGVTPVFVFAEQGDALAGALLAVSGAALAVLGLMAFSGREYPAAAVAATAGVAMVGGGLSLLDATGCWRACELADLPHEAGGPARRRLNAVVLASPAVARIRCPREGRYRGPAIPRPVRPLWQRADSGKRAGLLGRDGSRQGPACNVQPARVWNDSAITIRNFY